jgi:uncharacterized protein
MHRHDPSHLDVAALTADGSSLSGQWPASSLGRWQAMQTSAVEVGQSAVQWHAQGESRKSAGRPRQIWLHLRAQAHGGLTCQRCLKPFTPLLKVDRWIRFVVGEREAEALDADSDDDVLALEPTLDLRTLVEDELLLACPIVPRHDDCTAPAYRADESAEAASPFSVLAALKPPSAPN